MELSQSKAISHERTSLSCSRKSSDGEVMSIEECKKYIGKYDLSDQRITTIRDNLVGIVDRIMDSYLDNFR